MAQLLSSLHSRILADDYSDLDRDLTLIDNYRSNHPASRKIKYLTDVYKDLLELKRLSDPLLKRSFPIENNPNYQKFQTREYKICALNQSTDFRLGLSGGECHGFTYAMVDPTLSPYHNANAMTEMHHQQKIHYYQKNQLHPELEIKNTRVTRRHFCPEIRKQVEEIFSIADQHQEKQFSIVFQKYKVAHATYISVRKNGHIRFMDPNHGVYYFKRRKDFFDFYNLIYSKGKNGHYKFYQMYQISYDPSKSKTEPSSLSGKIRTCLTGAKYSSPKNVIPNFIIPVVTIAILTLALGSLLGIVAALAFYSASLSLLLAAGYGGYDGLLGIPHILKECWYNFTHYDRVSRSITSFQNTAENSQKPSFSTNKILRLISQKDATTIEEKRIEPQNSSTYNSLFKARNSRHAMILIALAPLLTISPRDLYFERAYNRH